MVVALRFVGAGRGVVVRVGPGVCVGGATVDLGVLLAADGRPLTVVPQLVSVATTQIDTRTRRSGIGRP